jgi:hypothetical protein
MDLNLDHFKGAGIALGILIALKVAVLLVLSKGAFPRIFSAISLYWKALTGQEFVRAEPKPKEAPIDHGPQLRLLGLLQRDASLVDFLMEDITGVEDGPIAAAVRDIQPKARLALKKYLEIGPCLDQKEGAQVEVSVGYHPSQYRITGNVPPQAPYRGELTHRGWKANKVSIPPLAQGEDGLILAPAEVEVS